MIKKKHSILIGAFVLSALLLFILLILVIGGNRLFRNNPVYRFYYETSVKGLNPGSPIMFRGVRIGQVTKIQLSKKQKNPDSNVILWPIEVYAEIDPTTLDVLKNDNFDEQHFLDNATRTTILSLQGEKFVDAWLQTLVKDYSVCAQLNTVSLLTGQLFIELDFHPEDPPTVHEINALTHDSIVPTRLSAMARLTNSLKNKDNALQGTVALLSEYISSGKAARFLDNLQQISEDTRDLTGNAKVMFAGFKETSGPLKISVLSTLGQAQEALSRFNQLMGSMQEQLPGLVSETKDTIALSKDKIQSVGSKLDKLLDELQSLSLNLKRASDLENGPVAPVLTEIKECATCINGTMQDVEKAVSDLRTMVAPDSPERQAILDALEEAVRAARSLRTLADVLQRNPEALIRGK